VTKLLIDGDVLAYRAGFATEKTKYLVPPDHEYDDAKAAKAHAAQITDSRIWSRKELEPEDKALMLVDVMIGDIRARFASEGLDTHIYLSGVGNYRNSIATRATYKGNRSGSPVPTHFRAIREHLASKWNAEISAGEEADDLIGIAATANPGSIVCSIDKDLMQLPGRHYNFATKEEKTVSAKEAVLNFYAQVLSGDPVDNVPGLTGIGPVKARKALAEAKSPIECWFKCIEMYKAEFGAAGQKYALEAARLVYVRRKVNETWNPPGLDSNGVPTKATKALIEKEASRKGRVSKRPGGGDSEGSERAGDQV
jgi:5'-3' exonuclease